MYKGVKDRVVKATQLIFAFGSQIVSCNEFHLFSPFHQEAPTTGAFYGLPTRSSPNERRPAGGGLRNEKKKTNERVFRRITNCLPKAEETIRSGALHKESRSQPKTPAVKPLPHSSALRLCRMDDSPRLDLSAPILAGWQGLQRNPFLNLG